MMSSSVPDTNNDDSWAERLQAQYARQGERLANDLRNTADRIARLTEMEPYDYGNQTQYVMGEIRALVGNLTALDQLVAYAFEADRHRRAKEAS